MLEFVHGRRAAAGPVVTARGRRALVRLGPRRSVAVVPRRRAARAVTLAAVGAVAAVGLVVAGSHALANPQLDAGLRVLAITLFVGVGAAASWLHPGNRLGLLIAGIGASFSLTTLVAVSAPLPFTLGRVTLAAFVIFTAYAFVSFPCDRLGPGAPRRFIGLAAISTAVVWVSTLAVAPRLSAAGPLAECSGPCPPNPFLVISAGSHVMEGLAIADGAVTVALLVGVAVVLVGKARSPIRLRRGGVMPLLWIMIATVIAYAVSTGLDRLGVDGTGLPAGIAIAGFVAIPIGLLVSSLQGRMLAAVPLGRLVAGAGDGLVTPPQAESLIAGALGDPTLELLLCSVDGAGYADVHGSPARLPSDLPERTVTLVNRAGRPVAALVHDRGLLHGEATKVGVALTALVLLENAQLVEQLRTSRARIAEAAQQERARLERDLHDGAQQRLMGIQVKLSLVRNVGDPLDRDAILDEIEADAVMAVDELRTLAHGIYPPLLRERGVGDALSSVAASAPGRVRVDRRGSARYSPAIEAAVYFSALEAMQNALKHAGSDVRVDLSVVCGESAVSFVVADAGRGFETRRTADGLGLVSIRDRMAAVGGALSVTSAPGRGTVVSGEAPARPRELKPVR